MRGTGYADHAGYRSPVYIKDAVHSAALIGLFGRKNSIIVSVSEPILSFTTYVLPD